MATRKVILKGNKKLKAKNETVTDFSSPVVKKLIKDLIDTMHSSTLIGIAAPQIGENYQIFVTHLRSSKYRKQDKEDILRIFINPEITYYSSNKITIVEGCGCVENKEGFLFGLVDRPGEVEVEAFDESGIKFSLRADGILGRLLQHEFDHLRGVEFTDIMNKSAKLISEDYYVKNVRNSKKQKEASEITKIEFKKL